MIKADEDALVCDLAETYHIYDYRQLPASKVAVFAMGLREDARIKLKLSGNKVALETLLLANIADRLNTLVWWQTKDGQKGVNRPPMIMRSLIEIEAPAGETTAFEAGEDFEAMRKQIIKQIKKEGGGKNGN